MKNKLIRLIVFGGVALGLAALASASNLTEQSTSFSRFITTQCRDARDAGGFAGGCKNSSSFGTLIRTPRR